MSTQVALLSLVIVATPVGAVAGEEPSTITLSADSRVRGLDREARRLLAIAVNDSPTVARLVVALEHSDLIVGVETKAYVGRTWGELRLVAATPEVRYLRATLKTPNGEADLVSVLGHELQHAIEMASAPDVRDQTARRLYYERIGWRVMGTTYFETDAAYEVGRRVAAELATAKSAAKRDR